MKPRKLRHQLKPALAGLALAGALAFAPLALGQVLNLATDPLGTATATIKPNLMFLLDTSGSMNWDYMPDYINDSYNPGGNPPTTASCYDAGDDNDPSTGSIAGKPDACRVGDPPYMSPVLNGMYYNPAIRYYPGVNYDGSSMGSMTAANTSNWTAVPTDPYNVDTHDQLGNNVSTVNLVNDYPDRIWCANTSDPDSSCVQNSAYNYPNSDYPYGRTSGGNVRYIDTAPYYYVMATAQWCSDAARTNCHSGSAVVYGTDIYPATEFCKDADLKNCVAGAAVTSDYKYWGVRWCSDKDTLLNCQRKKIGSFIYPKHLGTTTTTLVTTPAAANIGEITVTNVIAAGGTINFVSIGSNTVTGGSVSIPAGSSTATAASILGSAINTFTSSALYTGTPNYTASVSGSIITLTQTTTGSTGSGAQIVVSSTGSPTASAVSTLTLSSTGNSSKQYIYSIGVNDQGGAAVQSNLLCTNGSGGTLTGGTSGSWGNNVYVAAGDAAITANNGWRNSSTRSSVMHAIVDRINACSLLNGGYTAVYVYGSRQSRDYVQIVAPLSLGSLANGYTAPISSTGSSYISATKFVNGADNPDISTNTVDMNGGHGIITQNTVVRIGQGVFKRINIVPTVNSYSKPDGRGDCLGATSCTYDEEMTNFANWYAYYRTRLKTMKTVAGIAFAPVDESRRVGFITINPGSSVSSSKYLKIDDFLGGSGNHKQAWYNMLYSQTASGGTPLREALSRVGWIYAGKFNSGLTSGIGSSDDPIIMSCQPNFTLMATDGYWNGSAGQKSDGTAMDNEDNVDAGWSKRADGAYDGNLLPTTTAGSSAGGSGTLADVAMYYYNHDLRPTMTDNVPVNNNDLAPFQHMVTFTIGLGIDGELSYDSNYADPTNTTSDFAKIKQGTLNWPSPQADAPSAIDDLWHAAVNGRGLYFSAKNPREILSSLSQALSTLQTRVGAGAAAATSNLQPVAGDNFAFTAQYQTNDWIGDLKARTIDLSTGQLSYVDLWSGARQLDNLLQTQRKIYTFDPSDTAGNMLKDFCWPSDVGAGAWCSDGGGLDATEQGYFDPTKLAQYSAYTLTQQATVTPELLVNFLRGDTNYEDTGALQPTDLFRNRLSILGDIVDAQPAYVKNAPFSYSDTGYAEFVKCTQGQGSSCPAAQFPDPTKPRRGTVYAAANDGMLHAFETDVNNDPYYQTAGISTAVTSDDAYTGNNNGNGVERWAYVPTEVMPHMYELANAPYAHRYFVDGSPTVGDICISTPCAGLNDWRTILVGGFDGGGIGYYALDITNPLAPKGLWELKNAGICYTSTDIAAHDKTSDCNLGYSYGNPLITKRPTDGKWVVYVTSGYNNVVNGGDGQGYLYEIEAYTGKILNRVATGVGTAASPSGLSRINGYAANGSVDNTTVTIYGGDLMGNMWRINLDPAMPAPYQAVLLATAVDPTGPPGVPQPITTKPELGLVNGTTRVVLFGTGKFLENVDKITSPSQVQSIYGLRDEPSSLPVAPATAIIPNVRDTSAVIPNSFAAYPANATTRTLQPIAGPNWATQWGWVVDLPEQGERVNVDPQLQLGTLVVASNIPSGDTCTAGGTSWINYIDFAHGTTVDSPNNPATSYKIASSLTVGINVVMLPGGAVQAIITTADNSQLTQAAPIATGSYTGQRSSWRELIQQ